MGSIFDSPVTLSMTVLRRTAARARPRIASHSSGVNIFLSANARGVQESGSTVADDAVVRWRRAGTVASSASTSVAMSRGES
jgi:hypothetical protein